jgi:hypothetical protein
MSWSGPSATSQPPASCATSPYATRSPPAVASLRIADGVAQLAGSATATAHRRRGIQSALLAARLIDAAAAGCDLAVVTTKPASKSQQNVQRRGFDLLYTRAVLVKRHEAAVPRDQDHE